MDGDSQLLRTGAQGRYRFDDLNTVFASGKKSRGQQSLDRANVRLARGAWDITLGRQALSLGSARIISPTDVFLPFDLRVLDTEYRPGVDAIRFERSLGDLSMIDADGYRELKVSLRNQHGLVDGLPTREALISQQHGSSAQIIALWIRG